MGRALKLHLGALCCCLACAEPEFFALPEIEGASTFVLHALESDTVFAGVFGPTAQIELADRDRHLRLSTYRETLEALRLSPGRVVPEPCRACALLEPLEVVELDTETSHDEWRAFGEASDDEMLSIALPDAERCGACTQFEAEIPTFEAGGALHGAFVLPTDGTRAFLIDRASGAGYWVAARGFIEPACLGAEDARVVAVYSEGPDAAWVASSSGALSRLELGRLDPTLPCMAARTASTAPAGERIESMDGAPTGVEHEVFAMGISGQFHRYFAGTWARLGDPLLLGNRAAVWRAPGRGMGSTEGGPTLWYDRGDLTRVERILVESTELVVQRARRIDGVGVVLGAKPFMLIFEDEAGGWRKVPGQLPVADRVDAFTRDRSSYYLMLNGGRFRELLFGQRYCEQQNLLTEGAERELVALDDGTLVMTAGALRRAHPLRAVECE